MTPYLAEFIGTALLLLMGVGVNANTSLDKTYGNNSGWIVISFGWGFAVFIGVFVAGSISGAHLNPAVTVGLAVAGKFAWASVPGYIVAQLGGAMVGAGLAWLHHKPHYDETTDQDTILGSFSTGPAIAKTPLNLISEVIGTFVLVFSVFHIAGAQVGDMNTTLGALDALPVAFLVVAIGVSLGGTTGYAINPARDLGPRIMHAILPIPNKGGSNWGYSWIPIVGPLVGAVLAALLFIALQ